MRLIDADRVQEKIEKKLTEPSYQHEGEDWQNGLIVAEMFIDYAPTVDAIPIEWLKEHYPTKQVYGTEQYFRTAYAVQDILAEWERTREEE